MIQSDFNPNNQNEETASKIIAALERIAQAFRVLLWEESKHHQLTPIQVQVLIFIRFHPTPFCKVSYLANEFNMTKATISETIKTLLEKKLISKQQDLQDTRSYSVQLTQAGKKLADKTALFSKEIHRPIQSLPEEDKATMLSSLFNIIQHLNNTGIITTQRMCFNCHYYQASENNQQFYCNLLQQNFNSIELRIDCPEHEAI